MGVLIWRSAHCHSRGGWGRWGQSKRVGRAGAGVRFVKWTACETELGVRRQWGGLERGGSGREGELTQVSMAVTLKESVSTDSY